MGKTFRAGERNSKKIDFYKKQRELRHKRSIPQEKREKRDESSS